MTLVLLMTSIVPVKGMVITDDKRMIVTSDYIEACATDSLSCIDDTEEIVQDRNFRDINLGKVEDSLNHTNELELIDNQEVISESGLDEQEEELTINGDSPSVDSVWQSNFEYDLVNDRIVLKRYFGNEERVIVESKAIIEGTEYRTVFNENCDHFFENCPAKVISIIMVNDFSVVTSAAYMFSGCENLVHVTFPDFNSQNIENMSHMFSGCKCIDEIPTDLNTSSATNMDYMFSGCDNLKYANLSRFDTRNVITMSGMFANCKQLNNPILNGNNISTNNLRDISQMFSGCESLTRINLEAFDLDGLTTKTHIDNSVFDKCENLEQIVLPRKLKCKISLPNTFYGPDGEDYSFLPLNILKSYVIRTKDYTADTKWQDDYTYKLDNKNRKIYLTRFNGREKQEVVIPKEAVIDGVKYRSTLKGKLYAFFMAGERIDLSNVDFSEVTSMREMFAGCTRKLLYVNFGNIDTSNVTDMGYMFSGCSVLQTVNLDGIDTSKVTNMEYMFYGCKSLSNIIWGKTFNTTSVNNMAHMFEDCYTLRSFDLSGFETQNVTDMSYMFKGSGLSEINLLDFDTQNVTDMSYMFSDCKNASRITLGTKFTTAKVEKMNFMFSGCKQLKNIDLSNFVTSNVTNMDKMFYGSDNLIELDLSSFNTEKASIDGLFYDCKNLQIVNISSLVVNRNNSWDTSFFNNCSNLKKIITPQKSNSEIFLWGKFYKEDDPTTNITTIASGSVESIVLIKKIDPTGIKLDIKSEKIVIGQSLQIIPTFIPSTTSDTRVTWESSNPAVVSVNKMGVVKGIEEGTARISATSVDGGFTAYCTISVIETIKGDVTGDGEVAMGDVVKVARAVAGSVTLTDGEKIAADVTGDGDVAMGDVVRIARFVAGSITEL